MNVMDANVPNTNTPGGTGWKTMNAAFKYYIATAYFGDYAHLGSFIINADWMISQYGTLRDTSGTLTTIGSSNYLTKYGNKVPYQWFNTGDPAASSNPSSGYKFAPTFAVDGKTGKMYLNDVKAKGAFTVTSGSNKVTLDSNGFEAKWGNGTTSEGIRVGTNGIQRYDSVRNAWLPMYNRRNIKVDSARRSTRYTLPSDVDFFLNTYQNDSYNKEIALPLSSSLPDGAIITVRGIRDTLTDVYPSGTDKLSLGDYTATHVDVDNADRVDFVLCKQLSPATWLVNYYEIER